MEREGKNAAVAMGTAMVWFGGWSESDALRMVIPDRQLMLLLRFRGLSLGGKLS